MRLIDADRLLCVIGDGYCAYDGLEYQAYMSCLRRVLEDIEEAPTIVEDKLSMKEATIRDTMGYCLAKPGDRVRITKTHRAGKNQYSACEGDTFVITKVVDGQILYGRWLQPSGVLAASELKLDRNCCALIASEECGAPAGSEKYPEPTIPEPTTLRSVTIDVSDPKAAHKAVDDACAEYEDSKKIRWRYAEIESAKQNALDMMAALCEQGISLVWFIESDPGRRHVCLECDNGTPNTWAKNHGYSTNYVQMNFDDKTEFNVWIGRFVCLCKLMGEEPTDSIMRGIKIE